MCVGLESLTFGIHTDTHTNIHKQFEGYFSNARSWFGFVCFFVLYDTELLPSAMEKIIKLNLIPLS